MGSEVSQQLRRWVGERQNLAETGHYPTIEALARMKK